MRRGVATLASLLKSSVLLNFHYFLSSSPLNLAVVSAVLVRNSGHDVFLLRRSRLAGADHISDWFICFLHDI